MTVVMLSLVISYGASSHNQLGRWEIIHFRTCTIMVATRFRVTRRQVAGLHGPTRCASPRLSAPPPKPSLSEISPTITSPWIGAVRCVRSSTEPSRAAHLSSLPPGCTPPAAHHSLRSRSIKSALRLGSFQTRSETRPKKQVQFYFALFWK